VPWCTAHGFADSPATFAGLEALKGLGVLMLVTDANGKIVSQMRVTAKSVAGAVFVFDIGCGKTVVAIATIEKRLSRDGVVTSRRACSDGPSIASVTVHDTALNAGLLRSVQRLGRRWGA
jgi:hypothetical protein